MLKWILLAALMNVHMCFGNGNDTSTSYSKVRTLGSIYQGELDERTTGPKIYKSLSPMLNFSNPLIATTENTLQVRPSDLFSGRAYSSFPLHSYLGAAKRQPVFTRYQKPPNLHPQYKPYYPYAMERYTPGEAVASAQFKKNKDPYKYNPPRMKPTKTAEKEYTPPKDLYTFPPNLDSNYLPPSEANTIKHKRPITSYIPPPAGVPNMGFLGPINPEYLPPSIQDHQAEIYLDKQPSEDVMTSSDSADDMLPPLTNGDLQLNSKDPSSDKDPVFADEGSSEKTKEPVEDDMLPNIDSMNMQMPTSNAKPPMIDDMTSDVAIPNDMFMYHNDHASYGSHGVDAYPEIIYDDHDHDHEHHHLHHVSPVMMTTTTMKPEPPPEPRVKKYSYFYLGRKLWYIPLYFTVWFSFYIFWLIIKSIARHKVNLPNHYTGRMMKRHVISTPALEDQDSHLNDLTVTVLNYINNFQPNHGKSARRR